MTPKLTTTILKPVGMPWQRQYKKEIVDLFSAEHLAGLAGMILAGLITSGSVHKKYGANVQIAVYNETVKIMSKPAKWERRIR